LGCAAGVYCLHKNGLAIAALFSTCDTCKLTHHLICCVGKTGKGPPQSMQEKTFCYACIDPAQVLVELAPEPVPAAEPLLTAAATVPPTPKARQGFHNYWVGGPSESGAFLFLLFLGGSNPSASLKWTTSGDTVAH
jgi:hypothetical protein